MFPRSLLQSGQKACRMGNMSREMIRIIFRESAGNDKLVQKTREINRLSSIRFDLLRVSVNISHPTCLHTYYVCFHRQTFC